MFSNFLFCCIKSSLRNVLSGAFQLSSSQSSPFYVSGCGLRCSVWFTCRHARLCRNVQGALSFFLQRFADQPTKIVWPSFWLDLYSIGLVPLEDVKRSSEGHWNVLAQLNTWFRIRAGIREVFGLHKGSTTLSHGFPLQDDGSLRCRAPPSHAIRFVVYQLIWLEDVRRDSRFWWYPLLSLWHLYFQLS